MFFPGCTENWQNDNFQCSTCRKFHQNSNFYVPVNNELSIDSVQHRDSIISFLTVTHRTHRMPLPPHQYDTISPHHATNTNTASPLLMFFPWWRRFMESVLAILIFHEGILSPPSVSSHGGTVMWQFNVCWTRWTIAWIFELSVIWAGMTLMLCHSNDDTISPYHTWNAKHGLLARINVLLRIQGSSILCMVTSSNGKISRGTGPFLGECAAHRWIPFTKGSDIQLWCFLWSAPEQTVEQIIETPVIWDATTLIVTLLYLLSSKEYYIGRNVLNNKKVRPCSP